LDGGLVIELMELPRRDGGWEIPDTDDGRDGFWHIGARVRDFHELCAKLKADGVRFNIEPVLNETAQVWCAFFYDPDGVVIELVGGDQRYSQTFDAGAAARRSRVEIAANPLFEHIAFTVPNWEEASAKWRAAGYTVIGSLDLSAGDPRGMLLYYLTDDSGAIVEMFTYTTPTAPALDASVSRGFAGILATVDTRAQLRLTLIERLSDGRSRYIDDHGLTVIDTA
jgi:catechol 2,3-dioxygenase-like lactoylglutathione lyase family enzyme